MDLKFGDFVIAGGHVIVQENGRMFIEIDASTVTKRTDSYKTGDIVVKIETGEIGKIVSLGAERYGMAQPHVSYMRGSWLHTSNRESFLHIRKAHEGETTRYLKECAEHDTKEQRKKIADVATETLFEEIAARLKTK